MRNKNFFSAVLIFILTNSTFSWAECDTRSILTSTQKIISSQKISSRNDDDFLYVISVENTNKENDPYRMVVLNSACDKIFEYRSGDYPFSIFTLSDTSEAIFSLSTSGSALVINAFYIDLNNAVSHAFNAHSRNPPSFRFNKSSTMPEIILDDANKHVIYMFNKEKKKYLKIK